MAKALSIKEPYATLISEGLKRIETRSWKTNYRGEIYIHASSTRVPKEWKALLCYSIAKRIGLHFGQIVCKAKLVDCIEMTEEYIAQMDDIEKQMGFWSVGKYAWVLDDVEILDMPEKVKGHLGIWNLEVK